ncbi:hypothetical protein IW262DRAFT_1451226 [Armillaria fumosa]|nr:hypothetical protein IW262DRAFT_1451226 [Armillaria fumosa]
MLHIHECSFRNGLFLSDVSCLRIKDHNDLDEETIPWMDDKGHIHRAEAVAAEIKATQASS